MSSKISLKDFQKDTAATILEAFSNGPVFALADEVGLGKTMVCAEVALRLIKKERKRNKSGPIVIYYVAPSLELIDQNLVSIYRYLDEQLRGIEKVHSPLISRMSKIASEIANDKATYLVGLSPKTSFKITRTGRIEERAFLAALFGHNKSIENKREINQLFRQLKNKNYNFDDSVNKYREKTQLMKSLCDKDRFTAMYNEILGSRKKDLVKKTRQYVAQEWIKNSSPSLVILDEWHKYKSTCFNEKLMEDFLENIRNSTRNIMRAKLLLVSATPFAVKYSDDLEDIKINGDEDLQGLMEVFWGKKNEAYIKPFQELKKLQRLFIKSVEEYIKNPKLNRDVLKTKESYERELKKYCVRTERPKSHQNIQFSNSVNATWDTNTIESLNQFLQKFSNEPNLHTPILSMWQDGHTFPEFKEYKIVNSKKKSIDGNHWKLQKLNNLLTDSFDKSDYFHDSSHVPLWLSPDTSLKKYLIFSDFQFLSSEICNDISFGKTRKSKRLLTKVKLGYFPLMLKRGELRPELKEIKKNYHWLAFYPSFVYEKGLKINLTNDEMKSDDLIKILQKKESLFLNQGIKSQRAKARTSLFAKDFEIPFNNSIRRYFQLKHSTIGELIAEALVESGLIEAFEKSNPSDSDIVKFEEAYMNLSNSILHLFISDEARQLALKAISKKLIPRSLVKLNETVAFAIWYSNKFGLKDTLKDYANLLLQNHISPITAIREINSSINIRKPSIGSRFVRSFNDRKIEGSDDHKINNINQKSLKTAFNSPFPPYVLVTTSIGQEGLDFHRYCDAIIHWSPPASPNSLKQREGRLDRFKSKQNRNALRDHSQLPELNDERHRGLSPHFSVLDKDGNRKNHADSIVLYLPFSGQEKKWKRCLERCYYNDLLIGSPDPLSAEERLQTSLQELSKEDKDRVLSELQKLSVNLGPETILSYEDWLKTKGIK
jgi:superfamily II DNA or RNA helicase